MKSKKVIIHDDDARQALLRGINILTAAVSSTLGPKGRNVILDSKGKLPHITKDGVTVANEIELTDPIENIGAQLVKEVASKTNELAGDGTTTATVLTHSIFTDGLKMVTAGADPMELKRGIDAAVRDVVRSLRKLSRSIKTNKEIEQIATISSNNDPVIGKMMADIMDKVGKDGIITVQEASGTEIEVKTVDGVQFDKGYLSPYFVTNQEKMEIEMENPYILLYDRNISSMKTLLPLLEGISNTDKPLLIIANDVDGEALATLVVNKLRGNLKVAAVKVPGFGDGKREILDDIAVLTGGTVISEQSGYKLEDATLELCGTTEKIIIDKSTTTIINGFGNSDDIINRVEIIKKQIESTKSDFDKEKLQERLSKISGGVGIIYIGATTETELREKKDRVEDALYATRAAVDEGIVPGGGGALIRTLKSLDTLVVDTDDQNLGINIIKSAIKAPFNTILKNAGITPDVVYEKIIGKKDSYGYNVMTGEYFDMIEMGIIDPTKVTRLCIEHAASIAGLLLTTNCVVANEIEDVPLQPSGLPPMM